MARGATNLRDVVRRRIRELRRDRGLTQEELCEHAGISIDAISRIEGGSRVPTLDTIDAIAAALSVSPLAFFDGASPLVSPKKQAVPLRRIVALLEGKEDALLRLAETVVTAIVRAHRVSRRRK